MFSLLYRITRQFFSTYFLVADGYIPGKLAESDFGALARATIVYAGADLILPSLLHPNTDGILYSFGAVVSVMLVVCLFNSVMRID